MLLSCEKAKVPGPEKVKDDVSRSFWRGKRKTREQVPVYEAGMSKLKMVLSVEVIVAKKPLPRAVVGLELSTPTIRCGY